MKYNTPARARRFERLLLACVVLAQWLIGYNLVNWATWGRSDIRLIETAVDRAIPFSTNWILIYSMAYPVCLSPVFLVTLPRLRTACAAYTLAICASLITFVAFPVFIHRPPADPDALGAALMAFTRWIDQPFNCFPSLHVSLDFLAAFITSTERPRAGRALLAGAVVISFSTMVVKQHYFLDLIAGVLLAALAFRVMMKPRMRARFGDI